MTAEEVKCGSRAPFVFTHTPSVESRNPIGAMEWCLLSAVQAVGLGLPSAFWNTLPGCSETSKEATLAAGSWLTLQLELVLNGFI